MIKKWFTEKNNKDGIIIVILLLLNILPRLIYIFSNGFFIDGDEAIFGVMIRNFLNHGHVPLFFYGQNYGFVFFEVLLSSIISFFFGVNIFSMKIAMLIFWLMSMVILYYAGKKIFASRRWALLAVLLISFIPAWFDWATKARGGYLTALLLSNIIILLTVAKKNIFRIITISLLLVFIYYAQPLWLVITAPFVIYYFFQDFKFSETISFAIGSLVLLALSRWLLLGLGFNYQLQNELGLSQLGRNLENIFSNYFVAYSGRFFDVAALKVNNIAAIDSAIFIGILMFVILYDFWSILRKKIDTLEIIFLFSVVAYIFFLLFYDGEEYPYRFLLPIFVPSVFLIILAIKRLAKPRLKEYFYILLIIYAIFSLACGIYSYNFVFPQLNDGYTEIDRIESLKGFLQTNNIKCVYALDWIISQHINYFIPDVSVRYQDIDSRRPQEAAQVDYDQRFNDCALVGLWYQMPLFTHLYKLNDIYVISDRYIVHLRPQRADLLKLNFKLTN